MEDAGSGSLGDRGQRERLHFVLLDVLARLLHKWRLRVLSFKHDLIDQRGELFGEKREQPHDRAIFFLGNDRRHFPGFAQCASEGHAAFLELGGGAAFVGLNRGTPQHLSDPEKADRFFSEPHWHSRLSQSERARFCARNIAGVRDDLSVGLQADGESGRLFREESAEAIFVSLLMMLELPVFERPQRERQPGRFRENILVITKQTRTQQHRDELFVRDRVRRTLFRHGRDFLVPPILCQRASTIGRGPGEIFSRAACNLFIITALIRLKSS